MRKRNLLALLILTAIILGGLAQQLFFPAIWMDRDNFLGIHLGASKDEVMRALAHRGVDSVLPELTSEVSINKGNIGQIERLRSLSGVCVNDYVQHRGAKFSFAPGSDVVLTEEMLGKRFPELFGVKTRQELMNRLSTLLLNGGGIEAFGCIPESRWVRIQNATGTEDVSLLLKYDLWVVDVPNSYSGARLQFSGDRLSRIRYRWQPFELP
jgi:hypothetical protein